MKPSFPLYALLLSPASSFVISLNHYKFRKSLLQISEENNSESNERNHSSGRRIILSSLCSIIIPTQHAVAKDDLFKPNPLTNPILEQFRIWDQAEADQMKYGGELAPGSAVGRETYAMLLVPILRMNSDINKINELVREPNGAGLVLANQILSKPEFQKIGFKKIFNVFADNIYYSDPDRANLYLAGGAVPRNEQSLAYLLRNDILTNIEDLQAEVLYQLKERKQKGLDVELDDLFQYSDDARDGMKKYLDLVPPVERKTAQSLLDLSN